MFILGRLFTGTLVNGRLWNLNYRLTVSASQWQFAYLDWLSGRAVFSNRPRADPNVFIREPQAQRIVGIHHGSSFPISLVQRYLLVKSRRTSASDRVW